MADAVDAAAAAARGLTDRIVLTLRRGNTAAVRAAVLKLAEAGSASANGQQLVLTGKPGWLHRALRCVIRAHFGERDLLPNPSG